MVKSYKIIAASLKTLEILDIIAGAIKGVSAPDVAASLDIKYDTVMCHISTLQKAGYIEKLGDVYTTTLKLATFYAKKKAQLESTILSTRRDLAKIGAEYE